MKKIDNDEENEKSVHKTTNTLTNPNLNPGLPQNNPPTQQQKGESKNHNTTPATLKTPVPPKDDTKGVDITQRTIEVANIAVINNERIKLQYHSNFVHQATLQNSAFLKPTKISSKH